MDWVIPASLERADLEDAAAQLAEGASSDDQDLRLMCGLCSLALDVLNALTLRHGRPRVRAAVRSVLLGLAQELPPGSGSPSAGERLQRAAERAASPSYLAITAANCVPAVLRARDLLEEVDPADGEGAGLQGLAEAASAMAAGASASATAHAPAPAVAPATPDRRLSGSSGADHRPASAGIVMLGSPLDSSFDELDSSGARERAAMGARARVSDSPESPTTPPRPPSSSPTREGAVIASSRMSPSARGWGAEIPDSAVGVRWPGPHETEARAWRATAGPGARGGEPYREAGGLLGASGSTGRSESVHRAASRSPSPARSKRSSLGSVGAHHQRRLPIFGDGLMRRSKPGTREYEIEMAAERRRRMLDYGNARSRAAGEGDMERHVAGEHWGRDAGRARARSGRGTGPSSTSAAQRRGRAPRALGRVGTTAGGERPVPDGSFMEQLPGPAGRPAARKLPVSATARIVTARQAQPAGASEAATPDPSRAGSHE